MTALHKPSAPNLPAAVVRRVGHRAALVLLAAILAMPASSIAEENNSGAPAWLSILSLQLSDEYHCNMEKVLFEHDVEVGGRVSKEGRAKCLDGREFDFSRDSEHEKFKLKLCMPTVC